MAIVCSRPAGNAKVYVGASEGLSKSVQEKHILARLLKATANSPAVSIPTEPIAGLSPNSPDNTLGIRVRPYGLRTWGDLFIAR